MVSISEVTFITRNVDDVDELCYLGEENTFELSGKSDSIIIAHIFTGTSQSDQKFTLNGMRSELCKDVFSNCHGQFTQQHNHWLLSLFTF